MSRLQHATFATSANALSDLPREALPEIAFAGRSNAGKSSAINTLTRQNRLAYVSKTPGRTQLINFFTVPGGYLVDLPGYGYAEVPERIRQHWQQVLGRYLSERHNLVGLVLIMDIRHPLTKLDWQMIEWFAPTGRPIHVLLTKADKLARSHMLRAVEAVRKELKAYPQISLQPFSSLKRQGIEEAEAKIDSWLEAFAPDPDLPGIEAIIGTERPE